MSHDHRQSTWIIAGGHLLWCYQCGAWRPNTPGRAAWHRPTGIGGDNPAIWRPEDNPNSKKSKPEAKP